MNEFFKGIGFWFKSLVIVFKYGIIPYYLIATFVSIAYYFFIFKYLFFWTVDTIEEVLNPFLNIDIPGVTHNENLWNWVQSITLSGLTGFLAGILVLLVLFKISKYVILFIMSPVFSIISERLEKKLTGKTYQFNFKSVLKDLIRGFKVNFRNLVLELFISIVLWLIGFLLPFSSLITVPMIFIISCYFTGFSLFDYTLERRYNSLAETSKVIWGKRKLVIGIGFMYQILDFIPVVSIIIAPINGVVSACLGFLDSEKEIK